MSVSFYLLAKCQKAIEESWTLLSQKLADPASLVDFNISGSLVDAAKEGMGGLKSLAGDYIEQNSDALLMAALKRTGNEDSFEEYANLATNILAAAMMAKNDMVLKIMKECAWGCMRELQKKDEILIDIANDMRALYSVLASLIGTPKIWDDYFSILRRALSLVVSTRSDLKMVRNTFDRNSYWLSKKFDGTTKKLEDARDLITPKKNNPAVQKMSEGSYQLSKTTFGKPVPNKNMPQGKAQENTAAKTQMFAQGLTNMEKGMSYFGAGLSSTLPFPTTEQQWQGMVAINKLSGRIVKGLKGYLEQTTKVDFLVDAFSTGLDSVSTEYPKLVKKFVLNLMDKNISRADYLVDNMAHALNGSGDAISGPINDNASPTGKFRPNSISVSIISFKWIMDINLILQGYKLIPTKQLGALNLNQDAVNYYRYVVKTLYGMNTMRKGGATLRMEHAQEQPADLEAQMLAFLLEANNAIVSASIRKEILALGRVAINRLELSLYADHKIYDMMERFYYTPLPLQDVLDQIFAGLTAVFGPLDKRLTALLQGDFKKLFNLKGRDGAYVGAALSAIALLKACFPSQAEKDSLADAEAEVNSDMDLFNISFSINFDFAIFKNIQDCLRLTSLSDLFDIKELICDIATGNGVAKMSSLWKKMDALFTTSNESG